MKEYKTQELNQNNFVSESDRFKLDDFELYQLAREFRKSVYLIINQLPKKEQYILTQ